MDIAVPGRKIYIIAEIGINHNGSLENCYRLIEAAADAGCDAAKFQLFKAQMLYPRSAGILDWKDGGKKYSYDIYDASKRFEMPQEWIGKLMAYCATRKIDFLCSVSDKRCLDILLSTGLRTINCPSYAVTNIPFIEYCAKKGLGMILSTGGATLGEVEEAVSAVTGHHKKLTLLHCSISYPTELKECNMGVIDTLKIVFSGIGIGYSDHTKQVSKAAVQAVYLGAMMIEKHITLDKKMKGPDHFFALEPNELRMMVRDIRKAGTDLRKGSFRIDKTIYGKSSKVIYPQEKYLRDFAFMRLFAKRDIKAGESIGMSDIAVLRPGKKEHGLEPKYLNLFRNNRIVAKNDISFEDPITWDLIA